MGVNGTLSPDGTHLIEPEESLLGKVMAYAHMRGWRCFHDRATNARRRCLACGTYRRGPRNAPGFPDLVLLRARHPQPRMVIAELKREGESPSWQQRRWLDEFKLCGLEVFVWTSSDWDEIQRILL